MASQILQGLCPLPFLEAGQFPSTGGFIDGRICQALSGDLSCCLPCPLTDWAYPDSFVGWSRAASWVNVVGMMCCIFLLASWAFLPLEKTQRHYLSVSLTCAIVLMNLGFIIPLAGQPQECFDEITPNGMDSSTTCAISGAFLLGGGWAGVMWVFLRALSLHLQLCWQTTVGHNFVWCFQVLGWGVPIIGLVLALTLSGVSFRFGQTCHINHTNSLAAFWIPLLIVAGIAFIIHLTTLSYCIKVYLTFFAEDSTEAEGSDTSLHFATAPSKSPRNAYQRVRRVIQLQWRGVVIVVVILCDVIFFAVVFVFQESTAERVQRGSLNSLAWAACLVENHGDKTQCFDQTHTLIVNMATSVAVLILLAMNGIWLLLLLGRWSMVAGWIEFFGPLGRNRAKNPLAAAHSRGESGSVV